MTDYAVLRAEIDNDPLGRGYSGMTDTQIAASLNTANRTRNKTSMTATEVLNAVVASEYNALTDANKTRLWELLGIGDLNPFGVEATLLTSLFGGGSQTIAALATKRVESISRAVELGIGHVTVGLVTEAKAQ